MDPSLQDAPWHTVDTDGDGTTEHYGVPYQWGSNVLMYNATSSGEAPDSGSVVFEEQTLPDGESNAGRVQAYDGAIYIADAALYLRATQPTSGSRTRTRSHRSSSTRRWTSCGAARAGRPVLARRVRPDGRLRERRGGRELVVAVPGELVEGAAPGFTRFARRRGPQAGRTRR